MARRILLADDSVTAQNMGRRILSDAGYEVITVNNGSAALKKVAEQPPDVIVLDVYMPGYGGLEVCQRLKEVSETARIPILLTVGKLEPFKPDEARRVRADAFIIKPFEATELLAALTKLEDKIVPQSDGPKSGKVRSIAPEPGRNEEDTGWKNRLIIPPGGKGRSPEGMDADDFGQSAKTEVAKDAPKEVQKESAKEVEKVVAEEAPKPVLVKEEKPAAAEVAQEAKKPEEVAQTPAANVVEIRASETKPAEAAQESKEKEPEKETTVAAQAESAAASVEKTETPAAVEAAPPAATAAKGPRWVAETVALSADDTALPLEKEMEKSLAAVAALKAGLEAAETVPVVSEQTAVEPAKAESQPAATSETATATAETKPSEISEVKAPESAAPAAAVVTEADAKSVEAIAEVAMPAKPEAYAAAASMGATASESGTTEMRPASTSANSSEDVAAEVTSGNKQQLADAWEKWQNVRETVLNSPVAEQITEVAAASLKNAAELPGEGTSHASNPTNIANIVDSVLAELKPKLVEEIARKLGKDKK